MRFNLCLHLLLAWSLLLSAAPTHGADEKFKVVRKNVREEGLVGTFLRPKGDEVRPAILVLGGSEGGVPVSLAYQFAERGWAALALAYFGADGLPQSLANVPLEYFDTAAAWLGRQPLVSKEGLAVIGTSRGGELALLVGSRNASFRRVVAIAPSAVVWGPVGPHTDKSLSAWSVAGRGVPYVPRVKAADYTAKPYRGTPDFLEDLKQAALVEAAAIPVEKISGAVLLLSGEDDQVWPSTAMSQMIVKRLSAAKHPYRVEHVSFPGAGHLIGPESDPAMVQAVHPTGVVMAFGGRKKENRHAQEAGWEKIMAFLKADVRPMR